MVSPEPISAFILHLIVLEISLLNSNIFSIGSLVVGFQYNYLLGMHWIAKTCVILYVMILILFKIANIYSSILFTIHRGVWEAIYLRCVVALFHCHLRWNDRVRKLEVPAKNKKEEFRIETGNFSRWRNTHGGDFGFLFKSRLNLIAIFSYIQLNRVEGFVQFVECLKYYASVIDADLLN